MDQTNLWWYFCSSLSSTLLSPKVLPLLSFPLHLPLLLFSPSSTSFPYHPIVLLSNIIQREENMSGPNVDNLFPAIAQSFAVILIGYFFGRFNIIPPSEARTIGVLVGRLALPALLFKNLAILDLTTISWPFMAGILIAKLSVFVVVAVLTIIITRPINGGKGGLFGIFATQSNDFALGLPIGKPLRRENSSLSPRPNLVWE